MTANNPEDKNTKPRLKWNIIPALYMIPYSTKNIKSINQ